ncbi:MAG: hypothetical protein H6736_02000 [Alphaproteobacteria bacterium]|nr:hypothetical protein [Alphaproteobacteria bacterium]MCB9690564.1 hypothetical protein [Alphaproteobacteria bacterium]
MLRLGLLVTLALPMGAYAQDRQFRALELTDGRHLEAEILATEPAGLRMRIPQGETLISFELLVNISPITAAEYDAQKPMRLWVHSPAILEPLAAAYKAIPALVVSTVQDPNGLEPGAVIQLDRCAADFSCMAEAVDPDQGMWLVTALPPSDESTAAIILRARFSGGSQIERKELSVLSPDAVWGQAHDAIGLIPPGPTPRAVKEAFTATGTEIPDPTKVPGRGKRIAYGVGGGVASAAVMFGVGMLLGMPSSDAAVGADADKGSVVPAALGLAAGGFVAGAALGGSLAPEPPPVAASGSWGPRIRGRW